MLWFFIILGLLAFAPVAFGLAMAGVAVGVALLAVPFIVFVSVWGLFAWLLMLLFPGSMALGIIVGLVAGLWAARQMTGGPNQPWRPKTPSP